MLNLPEFKDKLAREGTARWMPNPEVEYFWSFDMEASREEIWVYLSDTSRFNREMGFMPRHQVERDGKQFVLTTMVGQAQEWIEEPWTWLAGQTMASNRTYIRGMAKNVQSVFHIEDSEDGLKRHIYIYFGWIPASSFWRMFLRASGGIIQKKFGETFRKIDELVRVSRKRLENGLRLAPPELTEVAKLKLNEHRAALMERRLDPRAIELLCDLITNADDLEVETLRVLPLAKRANIASRDLLSVCLHATRLGMLQISWEIICPHCRGSRFSAESLGAIPANANCEVCDLEFTTDDQESIEVLFHVDPSIRKVPTLLFCAAEPAKKNHIKVQQLVAPNEILNIGTDLRAGLYRARCIGDQREQRLEVDPSSSNQALHINLDSPSETEPRQTSTHFRLQFRNESAAPRVFVLEELWWENQALKPAHVLALPEFRELFAAEHLNSNVKLFLGAQTILFTDIVGSTKFYKEVGDAKAFSEVRTHFQEVFKDVQSEDGIVVKTMGDAVMASFPSIDAAMTAAIAIQKRFHAQRTDTSIRLRIAIHSGPVIAVHLNTGIDYFGNTVNFAAKIQTCAGAGEIALSEMVYAMYTQEMATDFPVERRRHMRDTHEPANVYVVKVTPNPAMVPKVA